MSRASEKCTAAIEKTAGEKLALPLALVVYMHENLTRENTTGFLRAGDHAIPSALAPENFNIHENLKVDRPVQKRRRGEKQKGFKVKSYIGLRN